MEDIMKLKYKKIILLTTMSTMGIGLLTLSISQDKPKAQESLNPETRKESTELLNGSEEATLFSATDTEAAGPTLTPTPVATPTPIPTPTPLPIYELEENKKMDSLFEDYYAAKASSDISKLKSLYSDPSQAESKEELESKVKYIEEYRNIKSYSKKGYIEGTYIVYVYSDIKFASINTLAPSLAKLYVVTDEEGNLKVFSGEMDPEQKAYFDERNGDEDVQKLILETDEKGKKAKDSDEDLMIFWSGLDKLAKEEAKDASKAQDTAQTEDTTDQGASQE
jgi:hypothetical protein